MLIDQGGVDGTCSLLRIAVNLVHKSLTVIYFKHPLSPADVCLDGADVCNLVNTDSFLSFIHRFNKNCTETQNAF